MKEAEAAFQEALDTYRQLAKANPATHQPELATTLNNLAQLYGHVSAIGEDESRYLTNLEKEPASPA